MTIWNVLHIYEFFSQNVLPVTVALKRFQSGQVGHLGCRYRVHGVCHFNSPPYDQGRIMNDHTLYNACMRRATIHYCASLIMLIAEVHFHFFKNWSRQFF